MNSLAVIRGGRGVPDLGCAEQSQQPRFQVGSHRYQLAVEIQSPRHCSEGLAGPRQGVLDEHHPVLSAGFVGGLQYRRAAVEEIRRIVNSYPRRDLHLQSAQRVFYWNFISSCLTSTIF